jgi:F-type H+-transporting ATPase subunit b
MRRLGRSLPTLLIALATLAPVLVQASEAGGSGGSSPIYDLVMKFINFGILAGILFYFLRKPVTQGLADRREDIRKELDEARQAKEDAEAKYQEYKERVARLEEEVRQIHEDFRAEGERQSERILQEAQQAAAGIRRQAEVAGASELKRALDELRAEVADLAVQLAEEMLAEAYTPEDQKKAVQQTIQDVERPH